MVDRATPNLPSRDFGATSAFYAGLGFVEEFRDDGWMILTRGSVTLEFFQAGVDAGLPQTTRGWPRLHAPRVEESGLRIGALLDPDASLLRLIANHAADDARGRA